MAGAFVGMGEEAWGKIVRGDPGIGTRISLGGADHGLGPRFRERQRGVENSGGGEHKNPSPKTSLNPPTYDCFPPPLFWRLSVISLKERGTRQTNPNFWLRRPPKAVLESTLCSTFPLPPSGAPPPNSRDTFCPPPQPLPIRWAKTRVFKRTRARRTARFENTSVSKWFFGPLVGNGRQRVGAFLKR